MYMLPQGKNSELCPAMVYLFMKRFTFSHFQTDLSSIPHSSSTNMTVALKKSNLGLGRTYVETDCFL